MSIHVGIGIGDTPSQFAGGGGGGAGGAAPVWTGIDGGELGEAPAGATSSVGGGGSGTVTVETLASSVYGRAIAVDRASGGYQVATTFDAPADGTTQEAEVLGIVRVDAQFAYVGVGLGNRDGAHPPNALVFYIYNGTCGLGRYQDNSGAFATALTGTSFNPGLGNYYSGMRLAMRLNLTYNSGTGARGYKAKIWDADGAEPGSWGIEVAAIPAHNVAGPFVPLFFSYSQGGAFGDVGHLEFFDWSVDPDVTVAFPS